MSNTWKFYKPQKSQKDQSIKVIASSSTKIKKTHTQKLIPKFKSKHLKSKHCDFQVFVLSLDSKILKYQNVALKTV